MNVLMQNPIILKINNVFTDISGHLDDDLKRDLKKQLSFRPENYQFNPNFNRFIRDKNGNKVRRFWDGYTPQFWSGKKRTYFPTGLMSIALDFLKERNVPYLIENHRQKPDPSFLTQWNKDIIIRPYQDSVINIAYSSGRGILQVPTGGGKTVIAAHLIHKLQVSPFMFFVTSVDLLQQTKEALEEFLLMNGSSLKIGQIGGGIIDIQDVNVCTVQTAVRALGERWDNETKFDSEDTDDLTPIEKYRDEICEIIRSTKGSICDEIQHWKSKTCQLICRELKSAYFTYGLSATPKRDQDDDMLIQSCFGKIIAKVTATELIDQGWLVRPNIKIVHIKGRKSKFKQWQSIYKDRVVECPQYNGIIANIANNFVDAGKLVLVLSQQVEHGKTLTGMIKGAQYLSGQSSKEKRIEGLNNLRNGYIKCISSSSLPYEETILVKHNGLIKQMEIGDVCHNFSSQVKFGEFEALCSFDGKTGSWSKITDTHIHKRENRLVRVKTNKKENVLVTENHSLIRPDLTMVEPKENELACVPLSIPSGEFIKELNLVELFKNIDDKSIEIEVLGINQPRIRKLNSIYKYIKDPNSISLSTRVIVKNFLANKSDDYQKAIIQFKENFRFYKRKFRAILSNVSSCKELFQEFECRIYIRRSRKKISLPTRLLITEELAIVSGIMCGDGHIKNHTGKSHKSIYAFDMAGLKDLSKSYEAKRDINKHNIRSIFENCFKHVFGNVNLFSNDKHLRFRSKLIYYLFKQLGHMDKYEEKTVPYYIFNSRPIIQESFLWGLYLADGSKLIDYRKKPVDDSKFSAIIIHNSSRPLVSGIISLLNILNKKYYMDSVDPLLHPQCHKLKIRSKKTRYMIYIVDSIYKLNTTRTVKRMDKHFNSNRFQKEITYLDRKDEFVYDISVQNCHNFVAGCGNILVHNSIFDEGIDIKMLDSVLLAGQGKSKVRAMQRIGRITRPYTYPDGRQKTSAIAVDFRIHDKYLLDHSIAREKMYRTEPGYQIEHINE